MTIDPQNALSALSTEGVSINGPDLIAWVTGIAAAPAPLIPRAWAEAMGIAGDGPAAAAVEALIDRVRSAAKVTSTPSARLARLRAEMSSFGVTGFLVPHADEHQSEFTPKGTHRLAWLTDFRGSAGEAVVLKDRAAVFVDGRYTLQVREQVDTEHWEIGSLIDNGVHKWLMEGIGDGDVLGYDPWVHTPGAIDRLTKALERSGATLKPLSSNLIDRIWTDQPPPPLAPIQVQPDELAGRTSSEKRLEVMGKVADAGAEAVVLSSPESIAWLLNIRGGDVAHTPMPLSYAVLSAGGDVEWFVDSRKLTDPVRAAMGNTVRISDPDAMVDRLDALGRRRTRVMIDPATSNMAIADRVTSAGGTLVRERDPCILPKAIKNSTELQGSRDAHARDAVAVSRFLAWIDRSASGETVTEIDAADELTRLRSELPRYRGDSFPTISGSGPNGAVVHYRVDETSNRTLRNGDLYLVDSGGQFQDGTTDITRTVAIGTPTDEMRETFTLVLKGHIALARARFPSGTTGSQLDVLARTALWERGLDFEHGTGHGVGAYLGVHEGPARISKVPNTVGLIEGMILSNEPGYYKAGAFGIRIENLVAVRPSQDIRSGNFLEFETLTLAPIDRRLIKTSLLSPEEIAWLDTYHARVAAIVAPSLDDADRTWLLKATSSLSG